MQTKHIVSLLQENYTTIEVQFRETQQKTYRYKALKECNIEVDDYVVVNVRDELKIVRVNEVHEYPKIDVDSSIDYKWIVQKIDTSAYDQQVENEEKFLLAMQDVERAKQKDEIKEHFVGLLGDNTEAVKLLEQAVDTLNKSGE